MYKTKRRAQDYKMKIRKLLHCVTSACLYKREQLCKIHLVLIVSKVAFGDVKFVTESMKVNYGENYYVRAAKTLNVSKSRIRKCVVSLLTTARVVPFPHHDYISDC